ncbi:MAG TPA: hypothetical protein VLT33_40315 [Labilithrix sp.]|nr:hypothetical protein [Labilithrix sp.]
MPPQAPRAAPGHRPAPAVPKAFAKILSASRRALAAPGHPTRPLPTGLTARPAATHAPGGGESKEGAPAEKAPGRDPGGEGGGDEQGGPRDDARGLGDLDVLDPATRHAASLGPPVMPLAAPAKDAAEAPLRARSLEELLPALVRRIAWAGDRHSGSVRLELGAGVYAGTTVVVHADGGRVRVEISGSEGPELERLRTRLDSRLRGHGLDVESVA